LINRNARWTGNIILPNISADSLADLEISKGKLIDMNKSGTVNRHLKTEEGDFISPTKLLIKSDATVLMRKGSRIVISKGASLEFELGAKLIMEKGAKIIVKKGGELSFNKANINKHRKAEIKTSGDI
jgi:hypothetical protein